MAALIISVASVQAQKSQVIAHRGYWKTAGSAQNSITSLQKADSIHCYGSEFDVWLAKDNKLVVNHDPVYKMKYMEYSKGDALTGLKLSNGENLPSLEQYLEAGKKCNTKLILELKALNSKKRETKAVQEILATVKKMGLEEYKGVSAAACVRQKAKSATTCSFRYCGRNISRRKNNFTKKLDLECTLSCKI